MTDKNLEKRIRELEEALRSVGFTCSGGFDAGKWECRSCGRKADEQDEIRHTRTCVIKALLSPKDVES